MVRNLDEERKPCLWKISLESELRGLAADIKLKPEKRAELRRMLLKGYETCVDCNATSRESCHKDPNMYCPAETKRYVDSGV